jgi:hypothetical protein
MLTTTSLLLTETVASFCGLLNVHNAVLRELPVKSSETGAPAPPQDVVVNVASVVLAVAPA